MEENHKLALIVAYYLSKYDRLALKGLGYSSYQSAYEIVGSILRVKANTIKNMRDEFDPLHDNGRRGWYQRELRPSRLAVVYQCGELSEAALSEVVKDILNHSLTGGNATSVETVVGLLDDDDQSHVSSYSSARGITGIMAEKVFSDQFERGMLGFTGVRLIDKRYDGVGYDFEAELVPSVVFEVKGLYGAEGGVTFTDREWDSARRYRDRYVLAVVSNLDSHAMVSLIADPYSKYTPVKSVMRQVAVRWSFNWTKRGV